MQIALEEARKARDLGEVPVGAIIVKDGKVLAQTHNLKETESSALEHAEIRAISMASKALGAWRLVDCDLYVTLEPCVMCAGAIVQSRLRRVVFGTTDPKGGGVNSLYQILGDARLNHQSEVLSGVLEEPCSRILTEFFKERRKKSKVD